jgi:hypothetical protein
MMALYQGIIEYGGITRVPTRREPKNGDDNFKARLAQSAAAKRKLIERALRASGADKS